VVGGRWGLLGSGKGIFDHFGLFGVPEAKKRVQDVIP